MRTRFALVLSLGMLVFALTEVNEARAAPAFQAAGTAASGISFVDPAWPAHAVDDIALLFVESAGGEAVTLTTPAGFAAVTGSPQLTGTTTNGTRITVFWARATSTAMATPRVADPGNHVYARILTYRGVIDSGNPWDVTGGGVKAVASTSVTVTGVTTVADTLIVQAVARDNDSAAAAFSAQTNGNLTGIAERSDDGTNSGNGGGIGIWDGVKATAGATGNTTATVTSSINAFLTIALRPGSITLGNGTDPGNAAIGPGGAATMADAFTFATAAGTNVVSAVVVGLAAGTAGGLSLVEITNDAGATVYGSAVNPATDTPSITLSTNTLTATTATTQFKIRVTPKSHVNMPVPPGSAYSVTAKINSWTSNYTPSGSDTAGTTVTIDNLSPANATASSCTAGTEEVTLGWTNPADSDFNSVVALRDTAAVSDTPVEGTTYSVGNTIGSSTVACATGTSPCTDTGLTGGTAYHYRLFARDSNGNYSATGVVPSGSPCTPASPAVPRFNACDVGTTCTNTTPSTQLYIKRAGVAFNLDLVALNTNGSRNTSYNNTVSVELLDSSDNSALPDTDGCRSTWSTIVTLSPNPGFVGADNGLITVGPFTVANAYREVRVRATNVGGASRRGCSTDNYSIRPTAFTVTSTDATQTGTSGTPAIKTGASFNLTAASVAGYDGTPTVDNTAGMVVGTPNQGVIGGSFGAAPIGTGTAAGSAFTYSEVGNFGLNANAIYDSSFTSVDQPADCTADFSNTLAGGKYGCSFGSSAIPQSTGSSGFGRFIPDHFKVVSPVFTPGCAAGLFTYMDQPFTLTSSIEARNSSDIKTQNYSGAYANGTVGIEMENNNSGTAITHSRLVWTGAWSDGAYNFSATKFSRPAGSPDGPYDLLDIGVVVSDEASLSAAARPYLVDRNMDETNTSCTADTTGTSDGTCTAIKLAANAKLRYGRLRLLNAYGSELLPLRVPVRAEYFNGTTWALNTADNCTSVLANAFYLLPVAPFAGTGVAASAVTLSGGNGTLTLTKPSPTATGSVDVAVNLGAGVSDQSCLGGHGGTAANKPWLRGFWAPPASCNGTAAWAQDPNARIKFGSPKAPYIYLRERY